MRSNSAWANALLLPIDALMDHTFLQITTKVYLGLIDWTACLTGPDKRGSVDATEPPILRKLGLSERQWHQQMLGTETNYWRAIGTSQALIEKAAAMGQGWLKVLECAQRPLRPQLA
jgi:hypothetical protein